MLTDMNGSYGFLAKCCVAFVALAGLRATSAMAGEKLLYTFQGGNDGAAPVGGLIADDVGNLYGTTVVGGGTGCQRGWGCGTVFKLAPDGSETVLYAFRGRKEGAYPYGDVIRDTSGSLYGTTGGGGSTHCELGCGTLFKLAPDGIETVLYAFQGGSDGAKPEVGLIMDKAGNLYGTTTGGGVNCPEALNGCGTVFRLAQDGTETVLYSFRGGSDGWLPQSSLIMDKTGNLYGTTVFGGNVADCDALGCGTVFKISIGGRETVLYAFQGSSDGAFPYAEVIPDKQGNLYGTTADGGSPNCYLGCGTVFKLAPDGTETVLHSFQGGGDGEYPKAGLIPDSAGNLYGTTYGTALKRCKGVGCGAVFKLAPDGTETVLHEFRARRGGQSPAAALLQSKGLLYGTTTRGGINRHGIVFSVGK